MHLLVNSWSDFTKCTVQRWDSQLLVFGLFRDYFYFLPVAQTFQEFVCVCVCVFTCRSNLAVGSLVTTAVVVNVYDTAEIWYYYRLSIVGYRWETLFIKHFVSYPISCLRREVDENCALLGYYAALVVIPCRRFGTTYPSRNVGKELSLALRNRPAKCSSQFVS